MTAKDQKLAGKNFIHVEDFIRHKWGTDGLESFKGQDSYKYDQIFEEKLYPFEDYVEILQNIQTTFQDETAAYQIGLHRARNLLLAKGSGKSGLEILDKVAFAWPKFNNFGEVKIEKHNDDKVSVILSDYESHPLYCERMRGFFTGVVSGALKSTCYVNEVTCVCKGNEVCEHLIDFNR